MERNVNHQRRVTGVNGLILNTSAVFLAVCIGFLPVSAEAGNRVKGQYATSKQPYWKVGKLDKQLSQACQRGEFRQRKLAVYSVGFIGKQGRGLTGIANKNWNLIDRKGLAKEGFTYHFFNQGYSNCKVYVAKTPARRDGNGRR